MHATKISINPRCWNPPWRVFWIQILWKSVVLGLLLGQCIVFLYNMTRYFPYYSVDFAQYYFLAQWLRLGGEFTDTTWPWKVGIHWPKWVYQITPFLPYQPLLIPIMHLLSRLPYPYAYLLWSGGALLVWWLLLGRFARKLRLSAFCVRAFLFLFPSLWFGLYWGNADVYLAAGVLAAILLSHEGYAAWSGFLWGWLIAFKPFLLFGALPGLRRWRKTFLAGLIGGGLSAFLVAWRTVGFQGLVFLFEHLLEYTQITARWFLDGNASLTGWLSFWIGPETRLSRPFLVYTESVQPYSSIMGLALLVATLWVWLKSPTSFPWFEEGLWLTLAMLMAPFAWSQYLLYLFGPMVTFHAFVHQEENPRPYRYAWYLLLPSLLSGFLWGGIDPEVLSRLKLRVISLWAGTTYLALWMMFWMLLYHASIQARKPRPKFQEAPPARKPSNTSM